MTTPIPNPPTVPFLGNVGQLDKEVSLLSHVLLARQYGEVYRLFFPGANFLVISSHALQSELSDEKRFRKFVAGALMEVRNGVGDGLFTAIVPGEENWSLAHRILMPAFSAVSIRGMFDDMYDIASQLALKWERFGPGYKIDAAADFTRLAFDTITLCAMSYRLNSFYQPELHPFIEAMGDFLTESGNRARRPGFVSAMMRSTTNKYWQDINVLMSLVDEIISERREHPLDKKDLLNVMLDGKDPVTKKSLPIENIRNNLLTFLIAGHETTSGMLTFIMYYLLKNPDSMQKLRDEIDTMIGDRPMVPDDVNKLPYLIAVMREALRLAPPAPFRGTTPLEDTTLKNGKYAVPKDQAILINVYACQRDPNVWGEDAEEFRPERMLDGGFEKAPPDAWQPFGFGVRACIGRPFAWQEAQMALILILQRFDFVLDDPSYTLSLKQTLTIKPDKFYVHATPRQGKSRFFAAPSTSQASNANGSANSASASSDPSSLKQPLYVLYGSNTGSSETFAQRIASAAASHGFRASLGTLDSAVGHIATDGPVVIVTASFEGQPADNAKHFVSWLSAQQGDLLKDTSYAVYGCGNRDWVATFQKIPTLVDDTFAERGAHRLIERGVGDAGASDFFESFDKWENNLWQTLRKVYSTEGTSDESGLKVQIVASGASRAQLLRQPDTAFGTVVQNTVLTAPGAPAKRHIEFALPEEATYQCGEYLAILPTNPPRDVHRALARFGLTAEHEITISSSGPTALPVDKPITVFSLLSGYVELSQPAGTREIRALLQTESSEATIKALKEFSAEDLVTKRLSVLDVLEEYPDIKVTFESFLQLLPSMRVRQYSISSSPLWNPAHATLTISVIEAPAISGRKEPFLGVASTYLASLLPGDKVQMAVRGTNAAFHLPSDPSIPLVLFGAGSGLAPLRGFLQERALQAKAGRDVGKSILFFGCRSPSQDYLYSDSDLKEWAELGIVDIRPAFSRSTEDSIGCKYVQDRVWHDREDVTKLYTEGAKFYLCGSSKLAHAVKEKLTAIIQDVKNVDNDEASKTFEQIMNGRFATDIFE